MENLKDFVFSSSTLFSLIHHECRPPATHEADRNVTHAQSRDQELTASPFPWLHKNKPCRGAVVVVSLNAGGTRPPASIHTPPVPARSMGEEEGSHPKWMHLGARLTPLPDQGTRLFLCLCCEEEAWRRRPPGRKPLLFSPGQKRRGKGNEFHLRLILRSAHTTSHFATAWRSFLRMCRKLHFLWEGEGGRCLFYNMLPTVAIYSV